MMMMMGERFLHLLLVFVVFSLSMNPASAFSNSSRVRNDTIRCIEKEREALLMFKQGLVDNYGHLSSWGNEGGKKDCCKWRGVKCSNQTGHVIMLNLHVSDYYCSDYYCSVSPYQPLGGKISPSLLELQHLIYLDLSNNDFGGSHIPMFLGYLTNLRHLDLFHSYFSGSIPYQLGNLTNLQYLNLGSVYGTNLIHVENLKWLSHLSSLTHLDMSFVNLSKAINWVQLINMLPSLFELSLSTCQLSDVVPPSLSFVNSSMSTLSTLDLSENNLTSSIYRWLFNLSASLVDVDLTNNHLQGSIPDAFQNMKSLAYLSLGGNLFEGGIPKYFGNMCTLKTLDLHWNYLNEELPKFVQNLSGCIENSLENLYLYNSQLNGSLPDMTRFLSLRELDLNQNQLTGSLPDLSGMSSLRELNLANNHFNGTLPKAIGQLSKLELLNVSYNSFEGIISEAHLSHLPRLKRLSLSFNSLSLNFSSHWVPPFQLPHMSLGGCKLGPHFPKWLQNQKSLSYVDISSNGISDSIPDWFWDQSPRLNYLNLSYNQIHGKLPNLSLKFSYFHGIDLSSNHFDGPLPLFPSNLMSLDLSKNSFSGPISSLCEITGGALTFMDLSNNLLSGWLPDCWMQFRELVVLNLGNNNLSGKIPKSIGSLYQIETLHLHKNSFFGELPPSLKNCKQLKVLDMGENKLSGKIPAWIGKSLSQLIVLRLRFNDLYGGIPWHLCHLKHIQILELSRNNISGTIPQCFNNFTAMSQKGSLNYITATASFYSRSRMKYIGEYVDSALLVLKGLELEYGKNLGLVKMIDLSSNQLTGQIPGEIGSLIELIALNLSRNNLTGQIIPMIGELKMLESLDLSKNRLSGELPVSLSNLNFLSHLDLSNNNLSGRIPTSTQLQSFNASTYMGNLDLCGLPLPNKCPGDHETAQDPTLTGGSEDANIQENEDGLITPGFYVSMALGFIIGFWGVCGSLFFNGPWRNAFFHFLNNMRDWLYVKIAVNMARLQRKLRS